ncbi:hypothetical protein IMG5_176530 [Ichthyophthirius multifiliis]|uniref:Uncharacterized protein n=1 Tax=Ichthyophthirius multifiliis TaxID=5932 RepID=G0R2A9_ICHMU|nr:hypothetical protein IMG5_176530 [Ichthyophthirius multifiliis]EGR28397.1 hypothetical protein IMG5_176530 [Ichthyophthirius multifiliis]|eukprot:XP_004027742.1 hypothetical protein IMG5_176530 [Ichthyophthirius multifiliis]
MGKNCVQNCSYGLNKTALYDKTFACQKCSKTNKCAEIDSYAEGMSVIGQFVEVENLRFPKYPYLKLKNQKILWAHALSGQQFLMADGVLGLGKQYDEMNGGYADEENTKNNIDEEFESKTEDEIEEDNDIQDENQKNPSNMYLYKEEGISLLETIKQQIEDVDAQIFTLYISDDAHYPMHIGFGNYTTQYIHEPEQNQIKWIYSPQHTAMESQYSLWIINIQYIRIVKKNIQQQDEKKEKEEELYEVLEPLDMCDEVQSLSDFDDLAMVISYDDKIILGEATLRNQYLVFEMNTKMIGFAPAKNKFNDMSFIQELEYLFEIVEQGFAADFPYILGLLCFSITGVVIFLVIRFKKYFKIRKLIIAEEKNDVKPLFKQNEHQMSEEMYKQLQMQESKDDKDTSLQPTQIGEY